MFTIYNKLLLILLIYLFKQDNVSDVNSKWSDRRSPFIDERKTPDLDHMSTDEYNTLSK